MSQPYNSVSEHSHEELPFNFGDSLVSGNEVKLHVQFSANVMFTMYNLTSDQLLSSTLVEDTTGKHRYLSGIVL